jgi:hypothetical protein
MKSNRCGNRVLKRGMAVALAGGSLFLSWPQNGCSQQLEREFEVLSHPEANMSEFYDSYLMTHSWGQQLVKWWNIPV